MLRYVPVTDRGVDPDADCSHLGMARHLAPTWSSACGDCLREGTGWVHLRRCLTCGHVGCCDDSPRRHAREHWSTSGHPLIRSVEAGEVWAWCFVDEQMLLPSGQTAG